MQNISKNIQKGINGIPINLLTKFKNDKNLNQAIKYSLPLLQKCKGNLNLQDNIINFYNSDTIVPYNPIYAKGPWIVSDNGAILYDVGGYGMLGFGHSPDWTLNVLAKPHVMANIMTPNIMQKLFTDTLKQKIGVNRNNECPYSHFAFLNSGSESMELATRISDINSYDKDSFFIVLKNSFHGRTHTAATISDSSMENYKKYLKSFDNLPVKTVEINDVNYLEHTFNQIIKNNYVKAVIMEPVMGEGNPGIELEPNFYRMARNLTSNNNSDLIIDSVQAGIRTNGYLSVVDYPNLKYEEPPDMEIFSKAINAGQYPLSVLAVTEKIAKKFKTGIYGNTMTGNPKALEIGYETLKRLDNKITKNIQRKGIIFKTMLQDLEKKYPEIVTHVTGKGLLLALHINHKYKVDDYKGLEYICRENGLNVIHGGENALRFTPYFLITNKEIELIKNILEISIEKLK